MCVVMFFVLLAVFVLVCLCCYSFFFVCVVCIVVFLVCDVQLWIGAELSGSVTVWGICFQWGENEAG